MKKKKFDHIGWYYAALTLGAALALSAKLGGHLEIGMCLILILISSTLFIVTLTLRILIQKFSTKTLFILFEKERKKGLRFLGFSANGVRYKIAESSDFEKVPPDLLSELTRALAARTKRDAEII